MRTVALLPEAFLSNVSGPRRCFRPSLITFLVVHSCVRPPPESLWSGSKRAEFIVDRNGEARWEKTTVQFGQDSRIMPDYKKHVVN